MPQPTEQLQQLIAAGRIDEAIAALLQTAADPRAQRDCAQLSGRWQANERARHLGTLSNSEYNLEKDNISMAVLALAEMSQSHPNMKRWWQSNTFWMTALAVLGLLVAVLAYLNDRGIWPKKVEPASVVSPRVEPEKSAEIQPQTPAQTSPAVKKQTNVTVKDKAKVGIISTGDSAVFNNVKQDF